MARADLRMVLPAASLTAGACVPFLSNNSICAACLLARGLRPRSVASRTQFSLHELLMVLLEA